jgi:hypothetical protein
MTSMQDDEKFQNINNDIDNDDDMISQDESLAQAESQIPLMYDCFYSCHLDWQFLTAAWGPIINNKHTRQMLDSTHGPGYRMQTLYYAQATGAEYNAQYDVFTGWPNALIQASMPLPIANRTQPLEDIYQIWRNASTSSSSKNNKAKSQPRTMSQIANDSQTRQALDDSYCGYLTDDKIILHPGEVNKLKCLIQPTITNSDDGETLNELPLSIPLTPEASTDDCPC